MDQNPRQIPNFITSGTPQGLRRRMLKNNARMGAFVRYFDIKQVQLNNSLVWIAWFYDDLTDLDFAPQTPKEVLDGNA